MSPPPPSDDLATTIAGLIAKERQQTIARVTAQNVRSHLIAFWSKCRVVLAENQLTQGLEILDDVVEAVMDGKEAADAFSGPIYLLPKTTRQCDGGQPTEHPIFGPSWGVVWERPVVQSPRPSKKKGREKASSDGTTHGYATFCEYLPDLIVRTWADTLTYWCATLGAFVATVSRMAEVVRTSFWAVVLVISLLVHLPMAGYDLLEFLSFGTLGVFTLTILGNAANYYCQWTQHALQWSVAVFVTGLSTHLWRRQNGGRYDQLAPPTLIRDVL